MKNFNKGSSRGGARSSHSFREGNRGERSFDGPRRDFGPREMHKAVCAECNKECEVPFKPREGRPVYCRECYSAKRAI